MHRLSAMDSPGGADQPPLARFDPYHLRRASPPGSSLGDVKLEASRFNGREPDQHRFDIETGPLEFDRPAAVLESGADAVAAGELGAADRSPSSSSRARTRPAGRRARSTPGRSADERRWSTTLAWGRRSTAHEPLDAFLLESAVARGRWTLFGRAERTENDELGRAAAITGRSTGSARLSLGAIRDFPGRPHVRLGLGGLWAFSFVPAALEPSYAGDPKRGDAVPAPQDRLRG